MDNQNQFNSNTPPNLDDIFRDLHTASSQPPPNRGPWPSYVEYADRLRHTAEAHVPRLIGPIIAMVAVVALFALVGWYMVRNLNQLPDMQMSAISAVQAAPQAEEYRPPIATLTLTPTPYAQPQATPQPQAAPRQAINVVRVGNANGIVYEWGQTATGELVINHEGVNYCAPGGMSTDALWAIANTVYSSPDLRTHYICK